MTLLLLCNDCYAPVANLPKPVCTECLLRKAVKTPEPHPGFAKPSFDKYDGPALYSGDEPQGWEV